MAKRTTAEVKAESGGIWGRPQTKGSHRGTPPMRGSNGGALRARLQGLVKKWDASAAEWRAKDGGSHAARMLAKCAAEVSAVLHEAGE